jgi:hypothetical protein
MTSDLCQRPRKETHDFRRTNAAESGILFGVAADGQCLFPAGMQVDRAARRVEASASDQLIRHARALSGLRPAPPPFRKLARGV